MLREVEGNRHLFLPVYLSLGKSGFLDQRHSLYEGLVGKPTWDGTALEIWYLFFPEPVSRIPIFTDYPVTVKLIQR